MTKIINVVGNSPAEKAKIKSGDVLISLNNHEIVDVLDYMYYCAENKLKVKIIRGNAPCEFKVTKGEYEDLGLEFESFLMSEPKNCKNNCVFCFIAQLPRGLRDSLYFKDDDSRLSFLQGNYISLTSLTEREVERIIKMKLTLNVSIHTTNKDLRVKMLGNPDAGEALERFYKIANAGIDVNCQIVLCPRLNDGEELTQTLTDLSKLNVKSIACVPVGLTKYREGLFPLTAFDKDGANAVLDIIGKFDHTYASDELFIIAGRELPDYDYYDDFPQYENGVGMLRLLEYEFCACLSENRTAKHRKSLATGVLAAPFLEKLARMCKADVTVYAIRNDFFGEKVTVAGLVTGKDLITQLLPHKGKFGSELLIPQTMLKADEDIFLDDVSVKDVETALGVKVRVIGIDGGELYNAFFD